MNRRLRIILPVLAVVGAAGATSLVLTRPWDGPEVVERADASPREMGICNVSVSNIPDGVNATIVSLPIAPDVQPNAPHNTPIDLSLYLVLSIPSSARIASGSTPDPANPPDRVPGSRIYIDAATGNRVFEQYDSADEEALLRSALRQLHVGPWQPPSGAWPRTDTLPSKQAVDYALTDAGPTLTYRPPDDGAGLSTSLRTSNPPVLTAYNCQSVVQIDPYTRQVLRDEVAPGDRETLDRFFDEIRIR
jgi:hypothetical protein